jgi:alpha-beta hydrolase superfamily lysophospholipase
MLILQKGRFELETKELKLKNGYVMHYHYWKSAEPEKAIMHINHGMAEHSARYDGFALYLNKLGISVYAQDHLGHGLSEDQGPLGFFAETDGWDKVVKQSIEFSQFIKEENKDRPLILFGHSMGSFIARCMIERVSSLYCCAVIMGTACSNGLFGKIGRNIAEKSIKKNGPKFIDKHLDDLSFGSYNKHFDKNGSSHQWLSRDEEQVKKYEDDRWCGFVCTNSFYRDAIDLIEEANDKSKVNEIEKNLPILLISGTADPVGKYGKGVKKVEKLYRSCQIQDVTSILVPDARHELLNETNKDENMKTISDWIFKKL